jgi:hypothetical protein
VRSVATAVNQIPPALEKLVPVIVADKGRRRAKTLLHLFGAGLDYVDQRLPVLHGALGAASPGLPALSALVEAARVATSAAAPKVRSNT